MNSFAKGLFQLLIGWVRGLTALWDGDWTRLDSFFEWLTRHWLPLGLLLILIGSAADLMVWLLRWRPDLSWRSRLKSLRSFSVSSFLHLYDFAVALNARYTYMLLYSEPMRPTSFFGS